MHKRILTLIKIFLILLIIYFTALIFGKFSKYLACIAFVILPFFLAFGLSFMIQPLIKKLEKKFNHTISVMIVLGSIFVLIGLFLYFCIPLIGKQMSKFFITFPDYFEHFLNTLNGKLSFLPDEFKITSDKILNIIKNYQEEIINKTLGIFESIISYIFPLLTLPVLFVYFTIYFDDIEELIKKISVKKPKVYDILREIKYSMHLYFKSFFIIISLLSALASICFLFLGLDFFIIFGLIIGITDIIPYIGPYIGGTIVSIFVLTSNPNMFIYVLIVIFAIQIIEECILTPKIQGKAMKINPIVVIFSVSFFGKILGIFGMIIAVPITRIAQIVIEKTFLVKK